MQIYEELVRRGLIAQVTDEQEIHDLINNGKARFYIGFDCAADSLTEGNLSAALRKLYEIDNNRYAFLFEQRVYRHFTQYVFSQPKERLKWGYRRIVGYINLYATVKSLLEKKARGITDYTAEAAFLQGAATAQEGAYRDLVGSLNISVEEMKRMLRDCLPR